MGRSWKSKYGHPFSRHKNGLGFRGEGSRRGKNLFVADLIAMPFDERAPPCKMADELARLRVAEIIAQGMRLRIACDNCLHETVWTRGYMEKKLRRWTNAPLSALAPRLRCGGCRSEYVRVWRG